MSISNKTSATSIGKYMKSEKMDISTNIILDYTSYFAEAKLIDQVRRYATLLIRRRHVSAN